MLDGGPLNSVASDIIVCGIGAASPGEIGLKSCEPIGGTGAGPGPLSGIWNSVDSAIIVAGGLAGAGGLPNPGGALGGGFGAATDIGAGAPGAGGAPGTGNCAIPPTIVLANALGFAPAPA